MSEFLSDFGSLKRLKLCEVLSYLTAVLNIFSINPYFTISLVKVSKK